MPSFEERMDGLECLLLNLQQAQEHGQARLEQAFKRADEFISASGDAVASAMVNSADQAAKAHLAALLRVVDEIISASHETVAEASHAIREIRHSFQSDVAASQSALRSVNAEAERASAVLHRLGEQGAHGEQALKSIQVEFGSLDEKVAGHKIRLHEAIKQAESDAWNELGEFRERVRGLLPGYFYWLREGFNFGVMVVAITGAAWGAFFAAKAYVENNKGDEIRAEIVQKMVPVGRVWTALSNSKDGTVELQGGDLNTPILDVGNGVFLAMQPDGRGGWATAKYPGKSWNNLLTARVYTDQTRTAWFGSR